MLVFNSYTILIGLSASLLMSCQNQDSSTQQYPHSDSTDSSSSISIQDTVPPPPSIPEFKYIAWDLKSNDSLRKIALKIKGDSLEVLRHINRTDQKYWRNKDTFLIPEPFSTQLMDYALWPYRISILQDIEKFVIFSYELQIYGVYEKGQLIKWGATNMGKKATPTPTGLFFANWKGKRVVSTVNSSWILQYNFNIHNTGGVGWHQYEMPGYPASHSCLRLFLEDAMWLYDYAEQWTLQSGQKIANGTPVIVFGEYPWGQSKPWFAVLDNKDLHYSEQQITEIIQPHIEKIKESEINRLQIKANKNTPTTDSLQ